MKSSKQHSHTLRRVILFTIPTVFLVFILMNSIVTQPVQQFSDLAQSLLHGHLYFLHSIGGIGDDPVVYNGHQYWDEGIFPAFVLLPFVALFNTFHMFFYQGYLEWLLVLSTLYFVYALARRFTYTKEDSLILMFGFGLGSAYIGISIFSSGWVFAQVVNTFLLFWSLYEYFTHKRWWIIGIACAGIFLTRATAAPIIIFFILELWRERKKASSIIQAILLLVPLFIGVCLQGLYNFLRFHSPLNGGYEYQLISADSAQSRALGVFSIKHIPANLYSLVLGSPNVTPITSTSWSLKFPFIHNNEYGISIFITSPYYLYLLVGHKWSEFNQVTRNLLIAAAVSCIAVLCFYGIGRNQFGYRYSLDFLPELFVVFMMVYRNNHAQLTRGMKFLLFAAGLFNFYVLMTFAF